MHNSFFVPPEKSEFSQNNVTLTEDLSRVDVTSASLPPSLPRARAPGRGKCLTLPLLSIKMQYINEILLKMTQTSSFFKAIFLTYFQLYCKDEN